MLYFHSKLSSTLRTVFHIKPWIPPPEDADTHVSCLSAFLSCSGAVLYEGSDLQGDPPVTITSTDKRQGSCQWCERKRAQVDGPLDATLLQGHMADYRMLQTRHITMMFCTLGEHVRVTPHSTDLSCCACLLPAQIRCVAHNATEMLV